MIRQATADDLPLVRDLWDEFGSEIPDAPWRDPDHNDDFGRIEKALGDGGVLLADEDGIAVVSTIGSKTAELDFLHVRPYARGKGLAAELMREAVSLVRERGLEMLELHVLASNTDARAVYERWGFQPVELVVAASVDELEQRLVPAAGPTFGFVHVQTDDVETVKRDAVKVLRLEPDVEVEGNWVRVRSDATDDDPEKLKALAKELSYTTGGVTLSLGVQRGVVVRYDLFDRGADVDEYLSVPEYFGPLPSGDAYALGANATVVGRLTGADPRRVREVARTAASPGELPPAQELYEQIATAMGVQP
ncbi:MAG TPA: GNAT family N-acetyltransferase [Gaiellaceae bacterium]|jgi:ribosomal protein S18 acetylase RimI-like enzyme